MQGNAKKRSRRNDGHVGPPLAEGFERAESSRALLYLVEYNKNVGLSRVGVCSEGDRLKETFRVEASVKDGLHVLVGEKVNVGHIVEFASREFLDGPGLAHLTCALNEQGLPR